jgi:hypothetical protein
MIEMERTVGESGVLTTGERALVSELQELIESKGEISCSKKTLTTMGSICQKLAVRQEHSKDLEMLQTVMVTVLKLVETEANALSQHTAVLRGIFAGKGICLCMFEAYAVA